MAESAFPEQFRPQNLRSYITSYRGISSTASVAARAVTKSTATKGAITNPEGRRSPKTIEPWGQSDRDLDSSIIDTILYETNPLTGADSHTCLFPCRQHVDHVGEELVRLDSEHALLLFDADTLHKPATRIVQTLLASDQIRTAVSKVINRNIQAEAKGNGTEPSLAPGRISFGTHRNTVPKMYVACANIPGHVRIANSVHHEQIRYQTKAGRRCVTAHVSHLEPPWAC